MSNACHIRHDPCDLGCLVRTQIVLPGKEGAVAFGTAGKQVVGFQADFEVGQHFLQLLLLVGSPHVEGLVRVAHSDEGSVAGQDDPILLLCCVHHLPAAMVPLDCVT